MQTFTFNVTDNSFCDQPLDTDTSISVLRYHQIPSCVHVWSSPSLLSPLPSTSTETLHKVTQKLGGCVKVNKPFANPFLKNTQLKTAQRLYIQCFYCISFIDFCVSQFYFSSIVAILRNHMWSVYIIILNAVRHSRLLHWLEWSESFVFNNFALMQAASTYCTSKQPQQQLGQH